MRWSSDCAGDCIWAEVWFILILPESTFIRCKNIQTTKSFRRWGYLLVSPCLLQEALQRTNKAATKALLTFGPKKRTWKSDIVTKYEIRPKNAGFTFIRFPNNPPKTLCLGSWWSLWRWPCNAFGQGWSFWLICTHSLSCHVQLLVKPKHHFTH